jgi:hypothetical protein
MTRILPYSGTSFDRLSKLIKARNPKTDTAYLKFEFQNPTLLDEDFNTKIVTAPVRVKSTTDDSVVTRYPAQEVQYRRLKLDVLSLLPQGEIRLVQNLQLPFNVQNVLDKINEALGLNLQPNEVFNTLYTSYQERYRLEIKSTNNLAWLPSFYDFEATIVRQQENKVVRRQEDGSFIILE